MRRERAINEQTIGLIADRVVAALCDDLEAIAAELMVPREQTEQLTVGQVARRLGVARLTVYSHWREWGGYKLGTSEKAPIRFDGNSLPIAVPTPAPKQPPEPNATSRRRGKRRRRCDLLAGAPRLVQPLDGIV